MASTSRIGALLTYESISPVRFSKIPLSRGGTGYVVAGFVFIRKEERNASLRLRCQEHRISKCTAYAKFENGLCYLVNGTHSHPRPVLQPGLVELNVLEEQLSGRTVVSLDIESQGCHPGILVAPSRRPLEFEKCIRTQMTVAQLSQASDAPVDQCLAVKQEPHENEMESAEFQSAISVTSYHQVEDTAAHETVDDMHYDDTTSTPPSFDHPAMGEVEQTTNLASTSWPMNEDVPPHSLGEIPSAARRPARPPLHTSLLKTKREILALKKSNEEKRSLLYNAKIEREERWKLVAQKKLDALDAQIRAANAQRSYYERLSGKQ